MTLKHHPLKCFSHNSALIALLCLGSLFLNIEVLHGNPVPEFSSAFSLAKGIDVDLTRKKVRIPITLINEDASGLEFIVTIGTEKDYESLFSTSIRAKELHMALLMAELTPSENLMLAPSKESMLNLEVEMGGTITTIEDWLTWSDGQHVEDLGLYFKGSTFTMMGEQNTYLADLTLNVIAAWSAKGMLMGPSVEVGNPYTEGGAPHLLARPKLPAPEGAKGFLYLSLKK